MPILSAWKCSGISMPGTMSCFMRSSRTKKLWMTSRECMISLIGLPDGNLERRADDVVLAGRVLVVEAEGIAAGVVDQLEIGAAELAVGPGIAEAPGELLGRALRWAWRRRAASSKWTPAQILVPISTSPRKSSAVALVQMVSSLLLPWE